MAPAVRLVAPSVRLRDTVLRGLRELKEEGLPWFAGLDLDALASDFPAWVAERLADAHRPTALGVPRTHAWAVVGEGTDAWFVGRLAVQHALTDALRVEGGHVGYDTVPSARRRGFASEMLRQGLGLARGLGLDEVLVTCDDGNAASIRVIEKNGGVLAEKRLVGGDRLKRHYWIPLAGVSPLGLEPW